MLAAYVFRQHHGNQDEEPGWSASGDRLSEIFSTNPARKFSNCPAWLPPITVIPVSGFSWPKATKQGPHVALGGELPVGVLNGSCCPLADNLDREYPILFFFETEMLTAVAHQHADPSVFSPPLVTGRHECACSQ